MSDGPPPPRQDRDTETDAKPSIAEVAAWLRRAAESRDGVEELRPSLRRGPLAPTAPAEVPAGRGGDDGPGAAEEQVTETVAPTADRAASEQPEGAPDEPPATIEPAGEEPPDAGPPVDDTAVLEEAPDGEATTSDGPPADGSDRAAPPERPTAEAVGDDPPPAEEQAAPELEKPAPEDGPAGGPSPWSGRHDDHRQPAAGGHEAPQEADPPARAEAATIGTTGPDAEADRSSAAPAAAEDAAADSAPDAAADADDDEVPVVSEALARFASAVVQHNTAEVAVVRPTDEPPPKVEALVEDELPLAEPDEGPVGPPADERLGDDQAGRAPLGDDRVTAVAAVAEDPVPPRSSVASLFDLDLADLAARARSRAEERAMAQPPPLVDRPSPFDQRVEPDERLEEAFDDDDHDLGPVGRDIGEAPDGPVDAGGLDLAWDIGSFTGLDDIQLDERVAEAVPAGDGRAATTTAPAKAPAGAAVSAALARRRAKRKRFPRGQLKERIGFLRRVRAMLGVVIVTVLLGVAAGAAIGAFLVFLAFAIRSAIITG